VALAEVFVTEKANRGAKAQGRRQKASQKARHIERNPEKGVIEAALFRSVEKGESAARWRMSKQLKQCFAP